MKTLLALPFAALSIPLLAAFSGNQGNDRVFRADLSGDQEVPPVMTDTSGELRIQFARDYSSAELRLDVNDGERITQAHFHCGEAGVNGPVVVFLAGFHANGWDVDGRWIDNVTITDQNIVNTACGTTLAEIAQAMEDGRIYVNVHSVAVPSGVVRGQVEKH